jgi:hypothetical protein
VRDTLPPVLWDVPRPITVFAPTPAGATVSLTPPSASDICDAAPDILSDAPVVFPIGTTLVTFTALDDSGNSTIATVTVIVELAQDTVPPVIDSITANPQIIEKTNKKMVPVWIVVSASDAVDPAPISEIVSVTSLDPSDGKDKTDPDWEIVGPLQVRLRAEQSKNKQSRYYTITVRCRDASGNEAYGTVVVTVK